MKIIHTHSGISVNSLNKNGIFVATLNFCGYTGHLKATESL